jgi:hypothetical protein
MISVKSAIEEMSVQYFITPPFLVPFVQALMYFVVKNLCVTLWILSETLRYSYYTKLHKENTKNRIEEMNIEHRLTVSYFGSGW